MQELRRTPLIITARPYGQSLAALEAPPLQHLTAITRSHAGQKPVLTQPLDSFRLVGPLHAIYSIPVRAEAQTPLTESIRYVLFRSW